jgi:hypothetical protein
MLTKPILVAESAANDEERARLGLFPGEMVYRADRIRRQGEQHLVEARVRGEEPSAAAFEALATAAHDLWLALEGVRGKEPLETIRMPAAGLYGAIERLAKALEEQSEDSC